MLASRSLPGGCLLPLGVAALLQLGGSSGLPSHSLSYLIAMWVPDGGLLRFVALAYLDDLLLMQYDSSTSLTLPRAPWMRRVEEKDPNFWTWQSWGASYLQKMFTEDVAELQVHSNQSGEPYTFQRITRCKLSEDGKKGALMRYGYDGRDLLHFEKENLTWTAATARARVLKEKWDADLTASQRSRAFLDERCLELLQQYLHYGGEESLQRREPPVVKVAQKASGDSWETVVCRAYGFYPKEVTISWRKDEEVWEEGTLRGEVTPNSDGTYHTWLSIRMDSKDRSHYWCRVEHAGLAEPLDVAWKEPASLWALLGTVLGVMAAVLLLVSWIFMRHKTVKCLQNCPNQRSKNTGREKPTLSLNRPRNAAEATSIPFSKSGIGLQAL